MPSEPVVTKPMAPMPRWMNRWPAKEAKAQPLPPGPVPAGSSSHPHRGVTQGPARGRRRMTRQLSFLESWAENMQEAVTGLENFQTQGREEAQGDKTQWQAWAKNMQLKVQGLQEFQSKEEMHAEAARSWAENLQQTVHGLENFQRSEEARQAEAAQAKVAAAQRRQEQEERLRMGQTVAAVQARPAGSEPSSSSCRSSQAVPAAWFKLDSSLWLFDKTNPLAEEAPWQ